MENTPAQECRVNSYVYAVIVGLYAVIVLFEGHWRMPYIEGTNIALSTLLLPVAVYCALQWRQSTLMIIVLLGFICNWIWWGVRISGIDVHPPGGAVAFSWDLYILVAAPAIAFVAIFLSLRFVRGNFLAFLGCLAPAVALSALYFRQCNQVFAGLQSISDVTHVEPTCWEYVYPSVDFLILNVAASVALFLVLRTELKPKVAYPLASGIFLASFLIRPALDLLLTK